MQRYSRPLQTKEVVEDFFKRVLAFDHRPYRKIISLIVDAELGVEKFDIQYQTISSKAMRSNKYRDDDDRWDLREQIINELLDQKQLADDDKIRLTKGGALPKGPVKSKKQAFILIGLPASGKSTIASEISKRYGAIILDSDYAKRKLPEYNNHTYGASLVHEESSQITFGFSANPRKLKSLYEHCVEKGHNIIIPRIGQTPKSIIDLAKVLGETNGYKVHLILISLSKRDATVRAAVRYFNSKRYVPLGLIFDGYGNDPSLCYYYLRSKRSALFASFGAISTSTNPAQCTDKVGRSPASSYSYKDLTLQLL